MPGYRKVCKRRGQEKLASAFALRGTSADGLQYWCRKCHSAQARTDPNRLARTRQYREKNREHFRLSRTYEFKKHYGLNAQRNSVAKRRVRLSDNGTCGHGVICENVQRRVVWGRASGLCKVKLVCGGVFVPFEEMHMDHAVPLSRGGPHCYLNTQNSCEPCNLSKGDRTMEELGLSPQFVFEGGD